MVKQIFEKRERKREREREREKEIKLSQLFNIIQKLQFIYK